MALIKRKKIPGCRLHIFGGGAHNQTHLYGILQLHLMMVAGARPAVQNYCTVAKLLNALWPQRARDTKAMYICFFPLTWSTGRLLAAASAAAQSTSEITAAQASVAKRVQGARFFFQSFAPGLLLCEDAKVSRLATLVLLMRTKCYDMDRR